jgi:hypothetical protein
MQDPEEKGDKQSYEKPMLRVIDLSAEEVLSVGCKTSFGDPSGVAGSGCLSGVCSLTSGS